MGAILFCLVLFLLWFVVRVLPRMFHKANADAWRNEEIERTRHVLEIDPSNSGTRAKLAAFLIEDGDLEAGIHEYRTAISSSPHGPFTTDWKRKLRDALQVQEKLARGERIPGFNEQRVCDRCQAWVSVRDRNCPSCGKVINMGAAEWAMSADVQREIWLEAIPIIVVLFVVILIVMALPNEVKGTLIISTLAVGTWLFLRSFNV